MGGEDTCPHPPYLIDHHSFKTNVLFRRSKRMVGIDDVLTYQLVINEPSSLLDEVFMGFQFAHPLFAISWAALLLCGFHGPEAQLGCRLNDGGGCQQGSRL